MAGTQVTSPNQVTRYERKNIWQIIGFISVLILIFAYKLGIDSIEYIPFYTSVGKLVLGIGGHVISVVTS